ncbi:MAG TPA: arsenate reductase ArsC [Tissierellia bacterium]|nr:arsenate reductase ArsC [Tissierellia bacterium]
MLRVLFLGTNNVSRSQMAEAFLNDLGRDSFVASSAGLGEADLTIPPIVTQVMKEIGYDLSQQSIDSVFDFFKDDRHFDIVISLCDSAASQKCPVFPSLMLSLRWQFRDPLDIEGDEAERLETTRQIRDDIKQRVQEFIHVFQDSNQ